MRRLGLTLLTPLPKDGLYPYGPPYGLHAAPYIILTNVSHRLINTFALIGCHGAHHNRIAHAWMMDGWYWKMDGISSPPESEFLSQSGTRQTPAHGTDDRLE